MHITSVTRLRLDTSHSSTDWNDQNRRKQNNSWLPTLPFMWMTQTTMCCQSQDQMYLQNTCNIIEIITLFSIIIHHSHRCFHLYIYIYWSLQYFPNMLFISQHLRIFQHLTQYHHGNCRILADGMRIWHLECHHCITAILDRRSWPSQPRCCFWKCLQPFLLDFNQPHPIPFIWRNFIWMFRSCIKCSFYTTALTGRRWLWEWFQWGLTNALMQNTVHTSCIQHGTCIFQPCTQYTPPSSFNSQ